MSEAQEVVLGPEEIQTARAIHDTHRAEINLHREAMNKTVQWATTVNLAIAGGLLVMGSESWRAIGWQGKAFLWTFLVFISFFVVRQLRHSSSAINSNARVVVKLDEALRLFSENVYLKGASIYPQKWRKWGGQKGAGYYDIFYIVLVLLMAFSVSILGYIL